METILSCLVALLGGLNIFQFIFLRNTKKKDDAETAKATAESRVSKLDAYDKLLEQFKELQDDYLKLAAVVREKCEQISKLKEEIMYLKSLRCYTGNCPNRQNGDKCMAVGKEVTDLKRKK